MKNKQCGLLLFFLHGSSIFSILFLVYPLTLFCTCPNCFIPASLTLSPNRSTCPSNTHISNPVPPGTPKENLRFFNSATSSSAHLLSICQCHCLQIIYYSRSCYHAVYLPFHSCCYPVGNHPTLVSIHSFVHWPLVWIGSPRFLNSSTFITSAPRIFIFPLAPSNSLTCNLSCFYWLSSFLPPGFLLPSPYSQYRSQCHLQILFIEIPAWLHPFASAPKNISYDCFAP